MRVRATNLGMLLMGLALIYAPAYAHHGNTAYSRTPVELKGTVTQFLWANPHSIVMFDVKDDKGNVVHWAAEAGSPSALTVAYGGGWSRNAVKPGDQITIIVFPAKDGAPVGRFQRIIFPDGRVLHDSQDRPQNGQQGQQGQGQQDQAQHGDGQQTPQ